MRNWIIRQAERRDADALAACIDAAYAPYAARIADLPPVSADCAGEIADHQVWVAESEGEIVGGLVLIPEPGFMRRANVAVRPDHQGTGLGRVLLNLADRQAVNQGYRELCLATHADMPENIRLYTRFGWQECGRDSNKVSMQKAI